MFQRTGIVSLAIVGLAACGDDPENTEPEGACAITEHVRLLAPPEGWDFEAGGRFHFQVLGDAILYAFTDGDSRDDPDRLYWWLDRCTGETRPFPSLTPDLQSPYIIDTPAGRVLYARDARGAYYLVDRLDVDGDDPPRKIAGLPGAGFLDLNWFGRDGRPYAYFQRSDGLYTHAGDPDAPALRVAEDGSGIPYDDAILAIQPNGVRLVDPFTGEGEVLLAGAQAVELIDVGATPAETRVLWQPVGDPAVRVRRLDGSDDVLLDPSRSIDDFYGAIWSGDVLTFVEPEAQTIAAAFRADTGAPLELPDHLGFELVVPFLFDPSDFVYNDIAFSLVLPDPDDHVEALWLPQTGELHEWYRGPAPAPGVWGFDPHGLSVDYYFAEDGDPPVGSLWRVDLTTGDRRRIAARVNDSMDWLDERTLFIPFHTGPTVGLASEPRTYDLKLLDIDTGLYTGLADDASTYRRLEGGLLYFDPRGPEPGLWARPLQ